MKYKMKAIIGQNHFELWQGDEKIRIISNPIMAFHVEDTLNMETAAYQEEIATLKAALSASGEKLAEVRGFVRDVAKERFIGAMCEEYQHVARKLVASWDSADDSAAESTPKQEVTLTEEEIDWIARHWDFAKTTFSRSNVFGLPDEIRLKQFGKRVDGNRVSTYYRLSFEFDTPANRAAIEARRKELKGE